MVESFVMRYLFVFLLVGLISCGDDATGNATGNATSDATSDAKNETAEQPSCKDVKGLQIADEYLVVPKDYTGVAFQCVDSKVQWLCNYKDGKKDGLYRSWEGQFWYEKTNYKDGKKDGLCRYWYESGQLWMEVNYKDGGTRVVSYGMKRITKLVRRMVYIEVGTIMVS